MDFFLTSFMCIRSLLLCPLHSFAAMSQWTSSKNTESIFSVLRRAASLCACHASAQRGESFRREVTLIAFLTFQFRSLFKPFFYVSPAQRLQTRSVCVSKCVLSEWRYGHRWLAVLFLTPADADQESVEGLECVSVVRASRSDSPGSSRCMSG